MDMVGEICAHVKNYFLGGNPHRNIHPGEYVISSGTLAPLDFLKEGQYFRIVGSTLNDGVYRYPASGLVDERFAGSVWAMEVTPSFIALADEIKKFCESESGKVTALTSESFGGYSYTRATDDGGVPLTWERVFAKRLNQYRRISVL